MHRLALIGFGNVGQGLCEILRSRRAVLENRYGFTYRIVAVSDLLKGSVYSEEGLDEARLLELVRSGTSLNEYSAGGGSCVTGWDSLKTIKETNASVICELTYTDIKTGQPAITHVREALSSGKHVVTSNKGPPALAYRELAGLASRNGVQFLIEGSVMAGTPLIKMARDHLAGATITGIRGILNGTTNFILTEMERGISYRSALSRAQEIGYAEADPTADVEGWDAVAKVAILAAAILDEEIKPDAIPVRGITQLTPRDVADASSQKKRWKLLGQVVRSEDGLSASVGPEMVDLSHPLAEVSGPVNAVTFSTDVLGDVTVKGPGAGKEATGFAVLSDLLEIQRRTV
ncbi:MAG: homoserine dehydrogenase [Fidelibacterota bacterium]